jgi:hypothetical protein
VARAAGGAAQRPSCAARTGSGRSRIVFKERQQQRLAQHNRLQGPATVTWEFGDGRTEEGETLTYACQEPGTYTVRFTTADAAGNKRTDTRTIQIPD